MLIILKRIVIFAIIPILVFCLIACESKKELKWIKVDLPNLKSDFHNFIEQRRNIIKEILIENGINPTSDLSASKNKPKDWLEYQVTSIKNIKTGKITSSADVFISGESKYFGDMDFPESIILMFDRQRDKWVLSLEDGYISQPRFEDEDKTGGLSPEIHAAIKKIFPYHDDLNRQ